MINPPTKFGVSVSTHYGDTIGETKLENSVFWAFKGHSWSPKIINSAI